MIDKVFAQSAPSANVATVLYSSTGNAITEIFIATDPNQDQVRIAIVPNGTIINSQCYIAYDTSVARNYAFNLHNICISKGDNVVVQSLTGTSSFTLTGQQID